MAPFTHLPSEIITLIVEFVDQQRDLYACTLTNKQFYIATIPLLWRSPVTEHYNTAQRFFTCLTTTHHLAGRWIQKLKLYGDFWTNDKLLDLMEQHTISHLEELHLHSTNKITDESMEHVPGRWPNLKTVGIWYVPFITQLSIEALGQHCHQLIKLDLCDGERLGCNTFSLLGACPLEVIHLKYPAAVLKNEKTMYDLIGCHPDLTELRLMDSYYSVFINRVLSAAAAAPGAWPNLVTLTLVGYRDTKKNTCDDDDVLVTFLKSHAGIKTLDFDDCSLYKPTFHALERLPRLTWLNVSHSTTISEHALRQLVYGCPQLGYVLMSGCEVTPDMFPEADVDCLEKRSVVSPHIQYLNHLDQGAIDRIRMTRRL